MENGMEYEKILHDETDNIDYNETKKLGEDLILCFMVYPEKDETKNDGYIYKVGDNFYHVRRTFNEKITCYKVESIDRLGNRIPLIYPTEKVMPEATEFAKELLNFIKMEE